MSKIIKYAVFPPILFILILGCGERQNPVTQSDLPGLRPISSPLISLPPGATVDSAIFSIYVDAFYGAGSHTINIHRITAPWDELTVTHNSFAGSYDAAVAASFSPTGTGWYHVDIGSLVQSWVDGTYPDYGFLIEQPESDYTRYASSEYGDSNMFPSLKVCYSLGGSSDCITIKRDVCGSVADAYIWELQPDLNFGSEIWLYTGRVAAREKKSLFQFDIEIEPDTSFSQLVPTDTECADFLDGTAQDLVMTVNPRGKIAPGGFFLFNLIQEPGDVTIEISMTVDPAGEPVPTFRDAKVYISGCENISRREGVLISHAGGVVTIFVPSFWVNQSQDNTLITRAHYFSPNGQAGTEFCFNTAVNGIPSSQTCVTVIPQ